PIHVHMMQDVADYIRYYNLERNHSLNDELSPVQFEQITEKVSEKVSG
ncbi:TPA: IS3 family transposase, partial [Enterobacter asburiae]|nr:IS3 family transposase [Enterobacter asburiae]